MKHPNLNISLTLYTLLMLLIPICFWANTYTWTLAQSAQTPDLNQFLILLTTTGGSKPYAIGFAIVFTLILAYFVRRQYRPLTVIAVCICAVVGTQAIKTGAKAIFKEPRPYVVQLAEQIHISTADFYALKKPEKRELIAQTPHNPNEQILSDYQQNELGLLLPLGAHHLRRGMAAAGGRLHTKLAQSRPPCCPLSRCRLGCGRVIQPREAGRAFSCGFVRRHADCVGVAHRPISLRPALFPPTLWAADKGSLKTRLCAFAKLKTHLL